MTSGFRAACVAAASFAAITVAGCSSSTSDSPEDVTTTAPIATERPDTPSGVCSRLLDDRDSTSFTAGKDAAFDLVLASFADEAPSADERQRLHSDLTAGQDALIGERESLAAAETGQAGWAEIISAFDSTIDVLDARIDVLATGGEPTADSLRYGEPYSLDVDLVAIDPRYAGRDCETVLSYPGPDPDFREFQVAAAVTCSAIVDRRESEDFQGNVAANLEVVSAVYEGRAIEPTDAQRDAVAALRDEWHRTLDDLESVPADRVADDAAWESVLALPRQRAEMFADRVDALDSGDPDAIEAAYDREQMSETPGWEGWDIVGLGQRDCRSIEA